MAVARRFRSPNAPRRAAGSSFFIARTAREATGALCHQPSASYGTVPVEQPVPPVTALYPVPPGPTGGHSAANEGVAYWGYSYEPTDRYGFKVLPTAGGVPHGIPGVTSTLALPANTKGVSGGPIGKNGRTVQTGAAQARVTSSPKPMFSWTRQGG